MPIPQSDWLTDWLDDHIPPWLYGILVAGAIIAFTWLLAGADAWNGLVHHRLPEVQRTRGSNRPEITGDAATDIGRQAALWLVLGTGIGVATGWAAYRYKYRDLYGAEEGIRWIDFDGPSSGPGNA